MTPGLSSRLGAEATVTRLNGAIEAAGLRVFARIDHNDATQDVGLAMPRPSYQTRY